MAFRFHWDPNKARSHLSTHGVGFEEAATVFGDPLSARLTTRRERQTYEEDPS